MGRVAGSFSGSSLDKMLNDSATNFADVDAEIHEHLASDALSLPNQAQQ